MNGQHMNNISELEANNFGPIVNAKIGLRPLTVFVGPSNTGKSYLAILIYALHKCLHGEGFNPFQPRIGWYDRQINEKEINRSREEILNFCRDLSVEKKDSHLTEGIAVPEYLLNMFYDGHSDTQGSYFVNEVLRCFGLDSTKALIRRGTRQSSIVFHRQESKWPTPIKHHVKIGTSISEFNTTIPEEAKKHIKLHDGKSLKYLESISKTLLNQAGLDKWEVNYGIEKFLTEIGVHIHPTFFGPFNLPAFYLPASRTGVMQAHRVVVRALIGKASRAGIRSTASIPILSGVFTDFLEQLIGINTSNYPYRSLRKKVDYGKEIEKDILGGVIGVEELEQMGYPNFTYMPVGWKDNLSLMQSSSMVSELAPVVLYLRHIVKPGSVIIVEEPESHLHPAMQVKFTRQLAKLVNKGIRVIITTHSEWVLEEIANIVRRSEIPNHKNKNKKGLKPSLTPNQVGAWLFKQKKRPKGSVVEEIILDNETGLFPTDYERVSEDLYNESVDIYNSISNQLSE